MSGVVNAAAGALAGLFGRDGAGNRQAVRDADFHSDSYGANVLGLDRSLIVAQKLQCAFADPARYYSDRNKALADLRTIANTTFETKFNSLRLEGHSDDQCKLRASKYTQAVMSAEAAEFEASWPLDVTNISASLTARRSVAGQGLMAIGNSATFAIPGSRGGRGGRGGRKSKK